MNYEKKYKEALEKARQFRERPLEEDSSSIVEYIFPELKENEDEKIRKELIQYIKNWKANIQGKAHPYLWSSDMEECNKLLAWLDKQGTSYTKRDVDDAFIEKACQWLEDNKDHPFIECEDHQLAGFLTNEFIEDFKKYMKEE